MSVTVLMMVTFACVVHVGDQEGFAWCLMLPCPAVVCVAPACAAGVLPTNIPCESQDYAVEE